MDRQQTQEILCPKLNTLCLFKKTIHEQHHHPVRDLGSSPTFSHSGVYLSLRPCRPSPLALPRPHSATRHILPCCPAAGTLGRLPTAHSTPHSNLMAQPSPPQLLPWGTFPTTSWGFHRSSNTRRARPGSRPLRGLGGSFFRGALLPSLGEHSPSSQIRMKCPLLLKRWLFFPMCLYHIHHVKLQGLSSVFMWPDEKTSCHLRTRFLTKCNHRSKVTPGTYALLGT